MKVIIFRYTFNYRRFRCVQHRDSPASHRLGSHRVAFDGGEGRGTKGEPFFHGDAAHKLVNDEGVEQVPATFYLPRL